MLLTPFTTTAMPELVCCFKRLALELRRKPVRRTTSNIFSLASSETFG